MATYIRKPKPFQAHQFDSTEHISEYPEWLQKKFEECELEIVRGYKKYNSIIGQYIVIDEVSNEFFIVDSDELLSECDNSDRDSQIWLTWFIGDSDYIILDLDGNNVDYCRKKMFEDNYEKVGE